MQSEKAIAYNIQTYSTRTIFRSFFDKYFLTFLYIVFSVSIIQFFQLKLVLFLVTISLGLIFIIRYGRIDRIFYYAIIYMLIVQLIAMTWFDELNADRLISLGLTINRFLLGYLIIKLGGKEFFKWFEKISFIFILLGLPTFFLVQSFPQLAEYLSRYDINSIEIQREYGGWNLLYFVHSGWAGFRFCGYAWEPGGMAMMITLSWIIYIINYGTVLNYRVIIYFLAMIFTFSTTGYFVLGLLLLFYAFNKRGKGSIFYGSIIILSLIIALPFIWKQDFMKEKLTGYYERYQEMKLGKGNFDVSFESKNVGRLASVRISFEDLLKWPIGHGTVTGGRTKNVFGEVLSGANGIMIFMVQWGIVGLIFLLYSIYLFIYKRNFSNIFKTRYLIMMCIILIFSSNQVSYSPVLYSILLYPYIYRESTNQLIARRYST